MAGEESGLLEAEMENLNVRVPKLLVAQIRQVIQRFRLKNKSEAVRNLLQMAVMLVGETGELRVPTEPGSPGAPGFIVIKRQAPGTSAPGSPANGPGAGSKPVPKKKPGKN